MLCKCDIQGLSLTGGFTARASIFVPASCLGHNFYVWFERTILLPGKHNQAGKCRQLLKGESSKMQLASWSNNIKSC